jgi:hypothetical protein
MKSANTALAQYMSGERFRREMDIARLWKHWPELVGREFADLVKPLERRGYSLILGVEDNLLMQEMVYHTETLLEAISHFLGWQPFDNIKYRLLQNRTALSEVDLERVQPSNGLGQLPDSSQLGALLDVLPEDTPFGRCYRAYIALHRQKHGHGEGTR